MFWQNKLGTAMSVLFVLSSIAFPTWAEPIDRTTLGDLKCAPGEVAVKVGDGATAGGGNGVSAGTWACATGGASYIFISNAEHDGAFGVQAWDQVCDNEAATEGLAAGDYAAWLSVSGSFDARDILPPGPFYDPLGAIIALSKADLLDARLVNSILGEASGNVPPLKGTWTGTGPDGTATGDDCDGWSSTTANGTTGGTGETTGLWTDGNLVDCDRVKPVFCIQVR